MFVLKAAFLCLCILQNLDFTIGEENCAKEGSSRSPQFKIKKHILQNYNTEFRPVKTQNKITNVTVQMILKTIDIFDENHEITIQNWMGIIWKDECLTWDPKEYSTMKSIHIDSSEIWTPDLKIVDKKNVNDNKALASGTDCTVDYTGLVSCVWDNTHDALCTNNLDRWPFDTRTCTIEYTTGVHNISQVHFVRLRKNLKQEAYFQNPSWDLINQTSSIYISRNPTTNNSFEVLKFNFELKRHYTRTVVLIVVPALSLIILTLIPLWMRPNNTENFCVIAANMFSHFLFIQHMGYVAPFTGINLPRLTLFFRDSLLMAVVVLIEMTVIKSLFTNERGAAPSWLLALCKSLSNSPFGRSLLIEDVPEMTPDVATTENDTQSDDNKRVLPPVKKTKAEKFLIASVIDRFVFAVLLLIYMILLFCFILSL